MNKRVYVALPTKLAGQFEAVAASLQMNGNQFGVHCLESCIAAIQSDMPIQVSIVRHARRILRKDTNAADRLLLNLLEKTFPELPTNTERFRELLIEETNRIDGELTKERLQAAYSLAVARWKEEDKRATDPVGELAKLQRRRRATESK